MHVDRRNARNISAVTRQVKKSQNPLGEARLVMRAVGEEETQRMKTTLRLVSHSLAAEEIGWLTGTPLATIRSIRKGFGTSLPRPGRATEKTTEFVFNGPRLAAVSALFVRALRDAMMAAGKPMNTLQGCGDEYLGALEYTSAFFEALPSSDRTNGRRLLMIGIDWTEGKLKLTACPKCRSEYLKSSLVVTMNSGRATQGECPICQLNAYKTTESRRAAVVDLQQRAEEISSGSKALASRAPIVFDLA